MIIWWCYDYFNGQFARFSVILNTLIALILTPEVVFQQVVNRRISRSPEGYYRYWIIDNDISDFVILINTHFPIQTPGPQSVNIHYHLHQAPYQVFPAEAL